MVFINLKLFFYKFDYMYFFLEIYSIPTKIFDSKFKVTQVVCGFEHIVILMETGCLYTQGSSRYAVFNTCLIFCVLLHSILYQI